MIKKWNVVAIFFKLKCILCTRCADSIIPEISILILKPVLFCDDIFHSILAFSRRLKICLMLEKNQF